MISFFKNINIIQFLLIIFYSLYPFISTQINDNLLSGVFFAISITLLIAIYTFEGAKEHTEKEYEINKLTPFNQFKKTFNINLTVFFVKPYFLILVISTFLFYSFFDKNFMDFYLCLVVAACLLLCNVFMASFYFFNPICKFFNSFEVLKKISLIFKRMTSFIFYNILKKI